MRLSPTALLLSILLWAVAGVAHARGTIDKVTIEGLDKGADAEMIENIEVSLSLYQSIGRVQGESRLEYLLNQAQNQARQALEPFGYYSPTIDIESSRDGDKVSVVIRVDKGKPVRVRNSKIEMLGWAEEDQYLQRDLAAFQPAVGEIFNHTRYEASKVRITRRLAERGYFDADFTRRRVEVTRADFAADIDLGWDSGRRYDMGPVRFRYDYFVPGLFDPLVYWEEGSYYHEGKLDRLRESLNKLGYFSTIDIQPKPEQADEDGRVPIDVRLELAKRTVYTAGLSYGSESGPGVRGGIERRYVNSRGHKMDTQLDFAQKRKSLTTAYRIPAFGWLDGWYSLTAGYYDEQTDYIDLRNVKLSASRSGQISDNWVAIASINALRERWRYSTNDQPDPFYQYATFVYPQIEATYANVDNRTFPRQGIAARMYLRGGVEGAGSDTSFAQAWGQMFWFLPVGATDRLILRGEAGTTWTADLVSMPPSLRFFAGGDNSIRGYAFREVGPRTPPPDKYALGGKQVITGSVEYERYFNGGPWGAAVFVDSGDAFDNRPDFHTGVGVGLRWKSPIGPVRVDVAHGLKDPDSQFQLYINIGANL